MELNAIIEKSRQMGEWAHVATVSASGTPYVTPVHPCWDGEVLWTMVGVESAKAKNVAANPTVSVHWQVSPATGFDSVMLWGEAEIHADLETKKRLWDGVFDYDLNAFAPGGPEDSPDTGFMAIRPTRAMVLEQYGMAGRHDWRADG